MVVIYEDEEIELSQLRPADHVYVAGNIGQTIKSVSIVLYYHHAVYLGSVLERNSESSVMELIPHITDFGRANKERPVIEKLENFLGGKQTVFRRNYVNGENSYTVESLLRLALAYSTGEIDYERYDLVNNNCEHYATLLRTGVWKSLQVTNVLPFFLQNNRRITRSNSSFYERSNKNVLKTKRSLFRQMMRLRYSRRLGFGHPHRSLLQGYNFSQEEDDIRQVSLARSRDTIVAEPIGMYDNNGYDCDREGTPRAGNDGLGSGYACAFTQ